MHSRDNNDGTFTNPLIFADYPDPDIIRVGGDFYLVSSSFTCVPGIPVCHSKDLVNWRIIGHVYDELPRENPAYSMTNGAVAYRGGSWAPCIRRHKGLFYVCFNTPAEGFFMCIAARPQGPYERIAFGLELYDPGLLFDDDGRVYVAHGCNGVCISELNADARALKSEPVAVYESAFGTPTEGSHLYKRDGLYYLCMTSRGYNGIQLCLRSRHIHGPYEARVISADDMNYAGAGLHQGGFVELENGQTWFFLFQDRDFLGRVPVLQPVHWIEGWPMLGDPENDGKAVVTCQKPAVPGDHSVVEPQASDDFDAPQLALQWHWNHNPDPARWSLTERPGYLRLRSAHASDFLRARNSLAQKIPGPQAVATATLDASPLQSGDIAGLAILGIPYALIGVLQETAEVRRVVMINEGRTVATSCPIGNGLLYLRCASSAEGIASFSWSQDNREFVSLGDSLTMQFTVKTFLGNQFALFCFNTKANVPTGYADFDGIRIDIPGPAGNCFSAFSPIPACSYDDERGTDTQRSSEKAPKQYLTNLNNGDWIRFNRVDFGSNGATEFHARASAIGSGGTIEIRLHRPDGPVLGVCAIPPTGNMATWSSDFIDHTSSLHISRGVHTLCLRFCGSGRYLFRLEHFHFN